MLCHCPTAAIIERSHGRQVRAESGSAAENAERFSAIAGWLVPFLLVTAIVVAWGLTVGDPPPYCSGRTASSSVPIGGAMVLTGGISIGSTLRHNCSKNS